MPVTIKSNQINVKNDGSYMSLDALSDNTTAQRVQEINSAASSAQSAITAKKADALASISEVSELENMIAEVFSVSKAYSVGDYVIQDVNGINKLYRFTSRHDAGAWNSNHVIEAKVGQDGDFGTRGVVPNNTDLDTIKANGCYVLQSGYTYTHNPVPSSYGGILLVYKGASSGNTITQIICTSSLGKLFMRTSILGVFNYSWIDISDNKLDKNQGVENAGKTLKVDSNGSIINEMVSPVVYDKSQTLTTTQKTQARNNIDAADANNTYFTRGWVEANTDINTLIENGVYLIGVGEYPHAPFPGQATLIEVHKATNNVIVQNAICVTTNVTKHRISTSGSFGDWNVGESFPKQNIVDDGTDLDTIKDPGVWILNSGRTYIHSPINSTSGGVMLVFNYSNNSVLQIVSRANTGELYIRASLLGNFPATWGNNGTQVTNNYTTQHYENSYDITCTPTITTDTNNYLASTGDTTDRTGDIQTMLNTTGICRLGPGNFYVTGIDIPNFGSLIGSGKSTKLILNSSVTTGYAVRLRTYSTVKDMYINGDAGNTYTPKAEVGNRHGILFEGTADAQSGAQTYYRSYITGCLIRNFDGGGITCNNTGLNVGASLVISDCQIAKCDVGVNISYFSEFHRITNVTAQECYYGCIDNGGNCNFSTCDFSGNKIGLLIDNSSGTMRNNTHGVFSACAFHHSDNVSQNGSITSVGTSIKILGANLGETFIGCIVGYGEIEIDNAIGIGFKSCHFGWMSNISVTNSTAIMFSDCMFRTNTSSNLTQSNNTLLTFNNCYTMAGTNFNPMS